MLYRILILLIIPLPLLANDGIETMVTGFLVGIGTYIILEVIKWISKIKPSLKKIIKPIESSLNDKNKINKLKAKLEAIELQITSFQEIKKTGKMSDEEENSWVELTREHKKTTDDIRKLLTIYNSKDLTDNEDVETQKIDDTITEEKNTNIKNDNIVEPYKDDYTGSEKEIFDNKIILGFFILVLFCVMMAFISNN